jgi:hypothetical protein
MNAVRPIVSLVAVFFAGTIQAQTIEAAVLPLPPALRAGATVVRLDAESKPETLRKGVNGMVCIADPPGDDTFDVRCYRDFFISVVYRAFQLGYRVAGPKVGAEVQAGKLELSREPTAGYRCLGPAAAYDAVRNELGPEIECWQSLHFPFRTASETGFPDEADLPEGQRRSMPYVMGSGTYWSHVMIRHPGAR